MKRFFFFLLFLSFFFCRFLRLPLSHCAGLTVMMGRSDDERDELIASLSKKDQPSTTLESSSFGWYEKLRLGRNQTTLHKHKGV